MSIQSLVAALPKAELHIHLEGSLEPELLFELARRNNVETGYDSVEALRDAYVFSNLQEFLDIYYVGMRVLLHERDYYDLAMAYFKRARADNVRHIEAFFDPQAHTERNVQIDVVVNGFLAAANDAKDLGISVYLIPCFLRHLPAESATATLSDLLPFVEYLSGVGLDSSEVGHPPGQFADVYAEAHSLGLKLVAHAGEEGPPDYVWEALDALHVDRIDHGNRAMEDSKLIERLAMHQTPLTVCPLSNLKLGVVDNLTDHPLRNMLDSDIVATINSDDPAYFGGYINENFTQIADALSLSIQDVITLVRNSFAASFLPAPQVTYWQAEIQTVLDHLSINAQ